MNICKTIGIALAGIAVSASASAQDTPVQQIKENIEIFSGILQQSLDLNQSSGLFGLSRGGVESSYLLGQGAVFEVQTPLASRRSRIGLASLNNALQSLQSSGNPLAIIRRPAGAEESATATVAIRSSGANTYYVEMMDRIANVDYSLAVNSALQQSYDAARSLLSLGNIDEQVYQDLRDELDALNESMEQKFAEIRQMQVEAQSGQVAETDADSPSLQERLDTLIAEIEPLREQVIARADELKLRNEQAAEEYARNWRAEVVDFEDRVYAIMCDYGATLRSVPSSEKITIILSGLGEDSEDNSLTDKIHVFSKADVEQCQGGGIDVSELKSRTDSYSY